jgi:hypothetical protein
MQRLSPPLPPRQAVAKVLAEMATPNVVAQHYLTNPLLIHGFKFDLRIYALVLSCDPLRVFLFHEGLARCAGERPRGERVRGRPRLQERLGPCGLRGGAGWGGAGAGRLAGWREGRGAAGCTAAAVGTGFTLAGCLVARRSQ